MTQLLMSLSFKRSFLAMCLTFSLSALCFADSSDEQDTVLDKASLDNQVPFEKIVGSAYSLKTGALLYRETHQRISDDRHEVEYSEPDGVVFGNKTLDFTHSKITPSFVQLNERNGERIEVEQENNALRVNYLENRSAEPKQDTLPLVPGMVVDAGFDAFVKQYWDTLTSGKEMDIEYLVPSKQSNFSFRVGLAECIAGTQAEATCFTLTPVSWFVRMAVDPITVAYDPAEKTLLRFTGRANICDENGKYQSVDIQYRYF